MRNFKVAIFGSTASYHDLAAQRFYGHDVQTVECSSFRSCCEMLKNNSADYAVMAIENSLAGSILSNYNLIEAYGFHIIGEQYLRIELHLLALTGVTIDQIETIHSHPMALAQCSAFLAKYPHISLVEKEDTASAVKRIREQNLTNAAAVGNELSSLIYNVPILKWNIQNAKENFTRFIILSKGASRPESPNKATVCFRLKHELGTLADVLTVFSRNQISLSKIQSVPVPGDPLQYTFHTDLEWKDYELYRKALRKIKKSTSGLSVLGEYTKANMN